MALYKLYNTDEGTQGVKKILTNFIVAIPFDPDNLDYQEYLEWAKTNTVDPAAGETWDDIRADRDQRLAETDWTQTPDVPQETIWKWKTYRQDLRDIPQKQTDPNNITWPTKPS